MADGTTLAKAYVQIMPSAEGITGRLSQMMGGEASAAGDSAGKLLGGNLINAIKGAIAAAGLGALLKQAFTAGGELEQSIGGIETLFGTKGAQSIQEYAQSVGKSVGEVKDEFNNLQSSQTTMLQNAQNAYKTAGISANDYMQTATTFGAALLQGLGGDTVKAAEATDTAIKDMSDNWNKFGSNQEDVMNAYKGFSKQNFTMLDNLKLGYGGTKSEMERLLADAQKLTGVKYDISNVADIYNAIHAVQDELGITGTTADEAAITLEGSTASMGAAFQNLLGNVALGENVAPAMKALGESVTNFLANVLRIGGNILASLPELFRSAMTAAQTAITAALPSITSAFASISPDMLSTGTDMIANLITGISNSIANVVPVIGNVVSNVVNAFITNLPQILACGTQLIASLVSGINTALPVIVSTAVTIITTAFTTLVANFPQIFSAGVQLLGQLVSGVLSVLATIGTAAAKAIAQFVSTIVSNLPDIIAAGVEIIGDLVVGIIQGIPKLIEGVKRLTKTIIDTIKNTDWLELGKNIIDGIIKGFSSAMSKIGDAAAKAGKKIKDAFKDALGIHSPSRVMANEVGKYIPSGVALGIRKNTSVLTDEMDRLATEATGEIDTNMFNEVSGQVSLKSMSADSNKGIMEKLEEVSELLASYMPTLAQKQLILDTGAVVGELADPLDRALGEISRMRGRL